MLQVRRARDDFDTRCERLIWSWGNENQQKENTCTTSSQDRPSIILASLPAIYRNLEALRAEEKVSKTSSRGLRHGVSKKSWKGRKVPEKSPKSVILGTFRPFRDFFWDFVPQGPGRLLGCTSFLAIETSFLWYRGGLSLHFGIEISFLVSRFCILLFSI